MTTNTDSALRICSSNLRWTSPARSRKASTTPRRPTTSISCGKCTVRRLSMVSGCSSAIAGSKRTKRLAFPIAPPGYGSLPAARLTVAIDRILVARSSRWPTMRRFVPPCRRNAATVGSLMAIASPSHAIGAIGGLPSIVPESMSSRRRMFASGSAASFPSKTSRGNSGMSVLESANFLSLPRYFSRRSSPSQTT